MLLSQSKDIMSVRPSMRLVAAVSASITLAAVAAHGEPASQIPASQASQSPPSKAPEVRERRVVAVNGKSEVWELQWVSSPLLTCPPDDPGWFTCPCEGFAFGESGYLDLVRIQDSKEIDRLHLTPLFADQETPAWETKKAVLQRWLIVEKTDFEAWDKADLSGVDQLAKFKQQVMRRKPVSILDVSDFNQDGWATEFVLQVGVLPCGKRQSILVGVSPERPQLHAFGTAEHPDTPLVLYVDHWAKLRTARRPVRVVSWTCGDHGSEEQTERTLAVDRAGIHVVKETFSCEGGREHGERLSREVL